MMMTMKDDDDDDIVDDENIKYMRAKLLKSSPASSMISFLNNVRCVAF